MTGQGQGRRIWIGGVRNPVDPDEIRRAFEHFGEIEQVETGFRGMAFILYEDKTSAERAVEDTAEIRLGGPPVSVKLATDKGYMEASHRRDDGEGWRQDGPPERECDRSRREPSWDRDRNSRRDISRDPRSPMTRRRPADGRPADGRPADGRRVWVGGIRNPVDPEMIKREFEVYGSVESVEIGFRGMAFVLFGDKTSADSACEAFEKGPRELRSGGPPVAVKPATERGYEQAVRRRDEGGGWRTEGGPHGRAPPVGARGALRGTPPWRRRSADSRRSESARSTLARKPPLRRSPGRRDIGRSRSLRRNVMRRSPSPRDIYRRELLARKASPARRSRSGSVRRSRSRSSPRRSRGRRSRRSRSSSSKSGRSRSRSRSRSQSRRSKSRSKSSRSRSPSTRKKRSPQKSPVKDPEPVPERAPEPTPVAVVHPEFGPGDQVEYHSSTVGQWIRATVLKWNSGSGTYDLSVKKNVNPDKLRILQAIPETLPKDNGLNVTEAIPETLPKDNDLSVPEAADMDYAAPAAFLERDVQVSRKEQSHALGSSALEMDDGYGAVVDARIPPTEPTAQTEVVAPTLRAQVPQPVLPTLVPEERTETPVPLQGREVSAPSSIVSTTPAIQLPPAPSIEPQIVGVALNFNGRRKCVRHLESTLVGDLVQLHLSNKTAGKPLVVLDKGGFEIGKELTLGTLVRQLGTDKGVIELMMEVDDW